MLGGFFIAEFPTILPEYTKIATQSLTFDQGKIASFSNL
ncbi:hypothetical protein HPS12939_1805 [Glaesserella parasuis 12939]|nr:hypothetical protein HPSMNH_1589 [Glaesserella parasuis MN-H]EQA04805.1 hypothetical protein HPS12939_1805 [Glaesserella parasuis 12939]EQA07066.1 hypothetical protein HPSD74_1923 [Glaesserella parasuis D74]EQA12301.1 hypothetical protein HPSSW140_1267 [Glaesserella parasuis SW140]